ncbi:TRAP transporter large permease [Cryobacterium psychrophilum]|uniref:TRAP transporter large permease n=1 Tax=Cryobacterium psychrophilum TaxID=41988 RepID=A0A4Y8KVL4_9MICO|nr:TRAP transporter large permease [Cryobacterium psychrophilum]TDW29522.1 tripartite ATP-independent transporter DctM subunit [Cryobacterium psychrophilum]TFD81660.1 TRAP transporter large permease [Cryobacterium psychrophilum]
MTLIIMIAALLLLLALRVPVVIALLVPSLVYVIFDPTANFATAAQQMASGVNSFALLAVPLFILLGGLANESGISERLYNAGVAWIGHIRGSLGYVNVGTSFGFSWMSGAAIADAAAMGRVQVPAMVKRGYDRSFSLGVTGASSLIAPMLPPSIPAIIYAVTAGVSVGALFVAGIVPALVLVATLCFMVWVQTRNREELRLPKSGWGERGRTLLGSLPAAGAAVVVLGGILSGIFTPTEASGIGVLYLFILAIAYRALTWKSIYRMLLSTVETSGSVLLIVASAALFGWTLARERAPQLAAEMILNFTDNPFVFLLLVNIFLLIIGAVLEPTAAILILVPVLAPVAITFGVDPIQFAVMMIFNLVIGLLTPPVGLVLFVLSSVTGAPVPEVIRGVLPFFIPMLLVLVLISLVPALSTWLPGMLGFS